MNPATRPYVDRPVGDVARADVVAATTASALGLPPPVRIRVGMNALYRCGRVIVRVGRPTASGHLTIELAERLRTLGIAVPVAASHVVTDGGDGLVATCWHEIVSSGRPTDWRAVGTMVRAVHSIAPGDLPPGYPLPSPASFPWWDFVPILADLRGAIDDGAASGIAAAIERHADWRAEIAHEAVVCHGDVHPGNVLMTDDGPVLLDWDLMCVAHPGWDHAMLLTLAERWGGDASVYPAFAAGYGRSLAGDTVAAAVAELRNVAATLMRVRAAGTDPMARDEAERRLRYWRGDRDAPAWRAQ